MSELENTLLVYANCLKTFFSEFRNLPALSDQSPMPHVNCDETPSISYSVRSDEDYLHDTSALIQAGYQIARPDYISEPNPNTGYEGFVLRHYRRPGSPIVIILHLKPSVID